MTTIYNSLHGLECCATTIQYVDIAGGAISVIAILVNFMQTGCSQDLK